MTEFRSDKDPLMKLGKKLVKMKDTQIITDGLLILINLKIN